MKLIRMRLKNFRTHADTEIEFPDKGSVGFIGDNEVGKSSIIEGMLWAFFGGKVVRGNMEDVRWWHAPPRSGAFVVVMFEVGGKRYLVDRLESTARLTLVKDSERITLAEGTTPVSDAVADILGMGYEEFVSTFLCLQKDIDRIPKMLPTERVAFVREVMQFGRIDEALKEARDEKNDLGREIELEAAKMASKEELDESVREAKESIAREEDRRERALDRLGAAEVKRRKLNDECSGYEEARRNLDRLESERTSAQKEVEDTEKRIRDLERKADEADAAGVSARKLEPRVERLGPLQEELDQLKEAKGLQERARELRERVKALEGEIRQHEANLASIGERLEEAREAVKEEASLNEAQESKRERLEVLKAGRREVAESYERVAHAAQKEAREYRERLREIEAAGEDTGCPTCLRPLHGAFDAVVDGLKAQIKTNESAYDAAKARVDAAGEPGPEERELSDEVAGLEVKRREKSEVARQVPVLELRKESKGAALAKAEGELATASESLASLDSVPDYNENRLEAVKAEIQTCSKARDEAIRLRSEAGRADEYAEALAESYIALDEATNKVDDLDAKIEGVFEGGYTHEALDECRDRRSAAEEEYRVAYGEVKAAEQALQNWKELLEKGEERLALWREQDDNLKLLRNRHRLCSEACEILERFRVSVAATVRPELEELMSGFLQILTDGKTEAVELDENFGVTAYQNGNPARVLSGGGSDMVALAMRLALSQLVAERAGHPLSFLGLDEPFGSLDETRRGNVVNLIRKLRNVFEQTLVISHVAETRDAVDHPVQLLFDYGNNYTFIQTE